MFNKLLGNIKLKLLNTVDRKDFKLPKILEVTENKLNDEESKLRNILFTEEEINEHFNELKQDREAIIKFFKEAFNLDIVLDRVKYNKEYPTSFKIFYYYGFIFKE